MTDTKQRVGIIFGGKSAEKEVSLNSGRNIFNIMDRARFDPTPIFMDSRAQFWKLPIQLIVQNTTEDIEGRLNEAQRIRYEELKTSINLAFPITFGSYGEDGCLQGLLKLLGIPFVGSDVLGAALGQDKPTQRLLLRGRSTINTPPSLIFTRSQLQAADTTILDSAVKLFGFPLVLKPARGGSTIGVSIVDAKEQWDAAVQSTLAHDDRIVVEPWIDGLEFSCVVIETAEGPKALTPTETVHNDRVFSYHEKYMPGAANKITPARVTPEQLGAIQQMCVETFVTLGLRGYARIDGFVLKREIRIPGDKEIRATYPVGTILITDPNVYSGMAPSSWAFHQAAQEDWAPTEFITKLIETVGLKISNV